MINLTPATDRSNGIDRPASDRADKQYSESERTPAIVGEPAVVRPAFDLFAEARHIYVRARGGRRVRSSSII